MNTPKDKPHNTEPVLNKRVASGLSHVNSDGLLNYRSHALPTWCPGCGYYGITHGLTQAMNTLNIPNENLVVVSGIGCAGRMPFFVNGYGFHSIHGRALPIASGVKMASPELTVLCVGGDGDGFGIGGGHIAHVIRRNVDLTYIVFDNSIYGLTKGQASPTTPKGQVTSTSPFGTAEDPINPALISLAYNVSFLATGYAGDPDILNTIFQKALAHRGFSMIIVTTPCITFDHVNVTWNDFRDRFEPIPSGHNTGDIAAAMQLAISGKNYNGVLYQDDRPDWETRQKAIRKKSSG